MSSYVDDNVFPKIIVSQRTAPANPDSGNFTHYHDSADGHYKYRNSAGTVTDITAGLGGGGGGAAPPSTCQGRLTLTTGTAITTADVTAATTLYFTPYKGAQVGTYSGSAWTVSAFAEKSLDISAFTAGKNYDIFIVDSTLALEGLVWTNDTTRATALVLQDGVYCKSGALTRRYLGTIRITGTTGQCEDSAAHRFVWNHTNRVRRALAATESTSSWTYGSATWRQARAQSANQVDYVCGLSEDMVHAEAAAAITPGSGAGATGVGVDSTSANSATLLAEIFSSSTSGATSRAVYRGYPGLGYHYLAWLEYARTGTITVYGTNGVADQQSGIIADVWA